MALPKMRRRDFALILGGVATIYFPLSLFPAPDLRTFLFPWLDHIRTAGQVGAFAHPFSNYTPPYLYLLAAFSTFGLSDLATVKLLSIAGAIWLAWCVSKLVEDLGGDSAPAFLITLLLPTVICNSAILGQCDAFWAGASVLAVKAAMRNRSTSMASWAGVAVAFKAQAAFLAPFCIGVVLRRRAWWVIPIPLIIYCVAIVPAALAGWPMRHLFTIYLRQPEFTFIGSAPNLWAIPRFLGASGPTIFPIGYALGAIASAATIVMTTRRRDILMAALLSSVVLPFFLPKMMERYFFLGDVLSLVLAYSRRDAHSFAIMGLIQFGSFLSIVASLMEISWLNAIASLLMGTALADICYKFFGEKAGKLHYATDNQQYTAASLSSPVHCGAECSLSVVNHNGHRALEGLASRRPPPQ